MDLFSVLSRHLQQSFGCSGGVLALISAGAVFLFLLMILWLNKLFFRWFYLFFSRNAYFDDEVEKKLKRYAFCWAILIPCAVSGSCLWLKIIQNRGMIAGFQLGTGTGILIFLLHFLFIICTFRLLAFFNQCYKKQEENAKRPIRAIVVFFYVILVLWGTICLTSLVARERPIILLSSFGAAAALFIFAFQNLLSSIVANIQLNTERIVKVGDWIAIESRGIEGLVEMISTNTIKVRNRNRAQVSFPVRLLMDETVINYRTMFRDGARLIGASLLIDQRAICFLSSGELEQLKKINLVNDGMLKKADSFDETGRLAGSSFRTNIELFTLYAEDYLRRRPDIRHDMRLFVRSLPPSAHGIPLEIYCYTEKTALDDYEPVRRAVLFHLLAILPSFRLRVFQECSDLFQGVGDVPEHIGGVFARDQLKNPFSLEKRV